MHILFATPDFVEGYGSTTGLPKYLFRVSKQLIAWGHKVSVVTGNNRTSVYEFEGIHVYCVRFPTAKKCNSDRDSEVAKMLLAGKVIEQKINEILKRESIDIIQYTSLHGLGYYRIKGIPSITRISSYRKMWPIKVLEEVNDGVAELEREAAKKCDAVFGPSYVVANELAKDIGKKVDVIETPFVMEDLTEDVTLYFSLLKGKKYLLFYGSIVEYKGVQIISKCVYPVLCNNKDIHLVLIGDGDIHLIDEIITNAGEYADRVIYHEAIGFNALKPIIRNAEAILLPSIMENFSNACVESMALGQIVIGTNGASFEQLIENERNGFLCEINDADSLIKTIERVLSLTEKDREIIRQNALKRAALLTPEIVIKQLLDYYEDVKRNFALKDDNY